MAHRTRVLRLRPRARRRRLQSRHHWPLRRAAPQRPHPPHRPASDALGFLSGRGRFGRRGILRSRKESANPPGHQPLSPRHSPHPIAVRPPKVRTHDILRAFQERCWWWKGKRRASQLARHLRERRLGESRGQGMLDGGANSAEPNRNEAFRITNSARLLFSPICRASWELCWPRDYARKRRTNPQSAIRNPQSQNPLRPNISREHLPEPHSQPCQSRPRLERTSPRCITCNLNSPKSALIRR